MTTSTTNEPTRRRWTALRVLSYVGLVLAVVIVAAAIYAVLVYTSF